MNLNSVGIFIFQQSITPQGIRIAREYIFPTLYYSPGNKNSVGISIFPRSINPQGIRIAWEHL